MWETLVEWDKQLFELLNGQWHNDFLDTVMPYWRSKKAWIPVYVVLAIFFVMRYRKNSLFIFLSIGLLVLLADQTSSHLIKPSVERLRPCNDTSLEQIRTLVQCGNGFSFTSSHASNHFGLSMFLFLVLPSPRSRMLGSILFLWAASIAYGQVYVGVHFPLDILAGACLGMTLGFLVYRVFYLKVLYSLAWLE